MKVVHQFIIQKEHKEYQNDFIINRKRVFVVILNLQLAAIVYTLSTGAQN